MKEQFENQFNKANEMFRTFNECVSEPYMEITQLNTKTANTLLAENNWFFEHAREARKPEDFIALNLELANKSSRDLTAYSQALSHILTKSLSKASETMLGLWNNMASDMAKTSEKMQSTVVGSHKERTTKG
jgi:hypothetical protein